MAMIFRSSRLRPCLTYLSLIKESDDGIGLDKIFELIVAIETRDFSVEGPRDTC